MFPSRRLPISRPMMRLLRFAIGRWLVHCGLRVMPRGLARAELNDIFWQWRRHVTEQVSLATGARAAEHAAAVQIARRWRDRARRISDG